ncbi:MAG: hypothetical protein AB7J35_19780 [Dehalococcoidia bacterium]
MRRRIVLSMVPLVLLAVSACGGDDDAANTPEATVETTPTLQSNEQPQVPDTPIAEPSPVPSDVPVIQVAAKGTQYAPLQPEFAALPKTSITANGKSYEGVLLSALAEKAGASATAVATIQGTRMDNLRLGAIRFGLDEIGSNTVLVMSESGHILLASTSVPPEQWLKDVTGIGFSE